MKDRTVRILPSYKASSSFSCTFYSKDYFFLYIFFLLFFGISSQQLFVGSHAINICGKDVLCEQPLFAGFIVLNKASPGLIKWL